MLQLIIAISIMVFGQPANELQELLPGLRVGEGVVEFDGTVAIDCHHPDTPDVYLEMLVTAPDSREHESLIVSSIKPSLFHAALLAAGGEAGAPLRQDDGITTPAHGSLVQVFVATLENTQPGDFVPIELWVSHHIDTQSTLDRELAWGGLVFAGSQFDKVGYAADRAGTLISLTSFGDEVVAPTWIVSHQAEVDEPLWIANRELVPSRGTPIRIRIEIVAEQEETKADESHQPDGIDIDRDM